MFSTYTCGGSYVMQCYAILSYAIVLVVLYTNLEPPPLLPPPENTIDESREGFELCIWNQVCG